MSSITRAASARNPGSRTSPSGPIACRGKVIRRQAFSMTSAPT